MQVRHAPSGLRIAGSGDVHERRVGLARLRVAQRTKGPAGVSRLGPWFNVQKDHYLV